MHRVIVAAIAILFSMPGGLRAQSSTARWQFGVIVAGSDSVPLARTWAALIDERLRANAPELADSSQSARLIIESLGGLVEPFSWVSGLHPDDLALAGGALGLRFVAEVQITQFSDSAAVRLRFVEARVIPARPYEVRAVGDDVKSALQNVLAKALPRVEAEVLRVRRAPR
jgi:hypothetical protein